MFMKNQAHRVSSDVEPFTFPCFRPFVEPHHAFVVGLDDIARILATPLQESPAVQS